MSVSPLQNNWKPSPVPGPSTVMLTSGACSLKSSWTRTEIGSTVDEPEMVMSPERAARSVVSSISSVVSSIASVVSAASSVVGSSSLPQATATRERAIAPTKMRRLLFTLSYSRCVYVGEWGV